MSATLTGAPFQAFYLPAEHGHRYCIYHPPLAASRGSVVYVPPFAEEMNKARRMAALFGRRLATQGYGVLSMDLYGCGDSSGELRDASWDLWTRDVAFALQWVQARNPGPAHLWAVRLGALLALDAAQLCNLDIAGFLLWQPVTSGEAHLSQFLRLRSVGGLVSDKRAETTAQLRDALARGDVLEVAGYDVTPEFARKVDSLKLDQIPPPSTPVHWFEVGDVEGAIPPAAQRVAAAWSTRGADVQVAAVGGPPFWSTVEITVCPRLIEASLAVLEPAVTT